jgi:hypothetical protein
MNRNTKNILALILIGAVSIGFLIGGAYLIYWQKSGTPTTATVTDCKTTRRSVVCRGSWFVNGGVKLGILENVNSSDLGKSIEVRAKGDRAIKPGLRLPIIFFVLGLGIAALGWYWWEKEAPRDRRSAVKT